MSYYFLLKNTTGEEFTVFISTPKKLDKRCIMYRTDGMELRLQSIVIFVSLFLFTLFPEGGHSAVPVSSADSNTGYIHLGPYLEIFEDHEKNFTFSRIISNRNRKLFSQNTIHSPSFGFTGSAFWVKFTLPPDMLHKKNLLLELDYPLMDHADIYVPDSRGEYTEKQYGSLKPFASRDLQHRNIVIKIPDDRTGGAPFYLRFENEDRMEFPLILWSEKAFRNNLYLEQFILGLYYGIMLVMMLYNLFIFFSVRDVSYLYYVLYILAMGIFQLGQNGFLYQLLAMFRDPPPVHFIPLTQGLLIAGILQFSQSYLNTKEYAKKFHLAMDILKACALVYIALFFVLGYTVSILIGVGITFAVIPVIMGSGITVVLKKYRPSYYFMAAWSVMFVAGFLFLLRVIAVIPHNTFTSYILHIGTTIEVILLSLGLGDRFNLIREERERISNELKIAKEIQSALIPRGIPSVKGITTHSEYIPMEEVGGDLFDYHVISDRCLGVLVADVSGHGVPAAIVASMVKVAFSLQVNHTRNPREVMTGMSNILSRDLAGTFITACYVCIDLETGKLSLARCGHLPLYIFSPRKGTLQQLSPAGSFISILPMREVEEEHIVISKSDRIIMITDGIIECRNRWGDIYGFQRFEGLIQEHAAMNPRAFSTKLIDSLSAWCFPAKNFDDDITLVVIDIE